MSTNDHLEMIASPELAAILRKDPEYLRRGYKEAMASKGKVQDAMKGYTPQEQKDFVRYCAKHGIPLDGEITSEELLNFEDPFCMPDY